MAKPSYIAYVVRGRKGQKDYCNKIGALFPHKDGKGFDLALDGKLGLRLPKTEPKKKSLTQVSRYREQHPSS